MSEIRRARTLFLGILVALLMTGQRQRAADRTGASRAP